jgi:hypothetical protein
VQKFDRRQTFEYADPPYAVDLLCAGRERKRSR